MWKVQRACCSGIVTTESSQHSSVVQIQSSSAVFTSGAPARKLIGMGTTNKQTTQIWLLHSDIRHQDIWLIFGSTFQVVISTIYKVEFSVRIWWQSYNVCSGKSMTFSSRTHLAAVTFWAGLGSAVKWSWMDVVSVDTGANSLISSAVRNLVLQTIHRRSCTITDLDESANWHWRYYCFHI